MSSVPFCINWKTKAEHFDSALSGLLRQKKLCDVTILCGGQVFKAHRLVLCICSEYFETVLQDLTGTEQPIIFLRDVLAEEFRYMLDYMYKGKVILPEAILNRFLETCKLLHIKGLYQDDTHSESDERESSKENSPSYSPIRRKKTKRRAPLLGELPKQTLLVNTQNSETSQDNTVAGLEASQTIIEETNGSSILDSPPRSPSSLVFSLNKLPEAPSTNDSLIVQEDNESMNDVIILSDDTQEEPPEETPSGSYFTSNSAVDQNTFMEGIELMEKSFQARSAGDSDESEIIVRKTRSFRKTAERNKNQTEYEVANKKKAIGNAQKLRVVLPKISQDESDDGTDKNEGSTSKRKKTSSLFRRDNA